MKTGKTYPIEVNIGDKCFKLINKMTCEVQIPYALRLKNSSDLFRGYFFTSSLFTFHSSLFSPEEEFFEVISKSE